MCTLSVQPALAQADSQGYFIKPNTFSVFAEYANDSSHIILGASSNRQIAAVGATYARRILVNHVFSWQYMIESRPVFLEADPAQTNTIILTSPTATNSSFSFRLQRASECQPVSEQFDSVNSQTGVRFTGTLTQQCFTDVTYAGGISPLGVKFNFVPRKRVQPSVGGNAGFVVATHDVPVDFSSRFNFTFEFGVGVEVFRARGRSIALEYRLHHLSNKYIGYNNPGVDSGLYKVTYSFGR